MDIKDKNYLNSLCIYELRAIAYNIGLKNSSTYRKKELIEKIVSFAPTEKFSNKGRPSKYRNLEINHINSEKIIKDLRLEELIRMTKNYIDFISRCLEIDDRNKYKYFIEFVKKLED